jgi:enoyl-CoA hydratase/carnithine racemase
MHTDVVRYEVRDAVATITIDDAERHNALSAPVRAGLWEAFRRFQVDDDVRVGILTGAGERSFSAGGDLKDMSGSRLQTVPRDYIPLPGRNIEIDKPWIAAVNGYAIGGGVLYTLLADLAVASSTATFSMPEARLGRGAPWSVPLFGQVPRKVWFEMAVTGTVVDADRAMRVGLVNAVVPPTDLVATATELALKVARAAPLTVAATRRSIQAATEMGQSAAWDAADEWFDAVYLSEDAAEGPAAWADKRVPQWKGR